MRQCKTTYCQCKIYKENHLQASGMAISFVFDSIGMETKCRR